MLDRNTTFGRGERPRREATALFTTVLVVAALLVTLAWAQGSVGEKDAGEGPPETAPAQADGASTAGDGAGEADAGASEEAPVRIDLGRGGVLPPPPPRGRGGARGGEGGAGAAAGEDDGETGDFSFPGEDDEDVTPRREGSATTDGAAGEDGAAAGGEFQDGVFVPTEEIRVDSAIAFPVDI